MDTTRKQAIHGIPEAQDHDFPGKLAIDHASDTSIASLRAEDEGRRCVEAAILTAITVVDTLDEAGRYGEHLSGNIAEAILWAIDEAGWEDHEALAAAALCKLDGHDPETRGPRNPDFCSSNILTGKGG